MKEDFNEVVDLPEGVEASVQGREISIKGPQGIVVRKFDHPRVNVSLKDNSIVFFVQDGTKREKKMIMTYVAHLNNLIKGVCEKFVYKLKICSSHFPMNVSVNNNKLVIKNFLGEKCPRELSIKEFVDVKMNGDILEVSSCYKESAGNVASDIELITRKRGKDVRIFQDGIYIIEKGGKAI